MKNQPRAMNDHKTHLEPWKTNLEPWKTVKTDLEPWIFVFKVLLLQCSWHKSVGQSQSAVCCGWWCQGQARPRARLSKSGTCTLSKCTTRRLIKCTKRRTAKCITKCKRRSAMPREGRGWHRPGSPADLCTPMPYSALLCCTLNKCFGSVAHCLTLSIPTKLTPWLGARSSSAPLSHRASWTHKSW